MTVLVVDVAAEHSGAVTILEQFIDEFRKNEQIKYIVLLSTLEYKDCYNVQFLNFKWVKKSYFHRIWFDWVYIKRVIKKYKPDKVLSLQNGAVSAMGIKQDVFFQNALPISDYKIPFSTSKRMWLYQNVIGKVWKKSCKNASRIIVQSEWIKEALSQKWSISIEKIIVKRPEIIQFNIEERSEATEGLFYPANGAPYKNHITLIKALLPIWEMNHFRYPLLNLTGQRTDLSTECQRIIEEKTLPVIFKGRLNKNEMIKTYLSNVLVFPSYIETVGLPLLEAKALGCTIIAADCAYSREILGDYTRAIFFSPFNVEELTNAIINEVDKCDVKCDVLE